MLRGKKIILGITGSIAAYKSILLLRLLVREGAEVKVVMTPAAKDFVTPLTLGTLSRAAVLSDLFEESAWSNHVELGRWADLMVVAPLSCNSLAKMANGLCDNLLLAVYLSATCPVLLAPAMDEDMWFHPSTRENLSALERFGNHVMPVEHGELGSGLVGEGRMAEPEAILGQIRATFAGPTGADPTRRSNASAQPLQGKKVLVTAGPTHEPLDPVRFIGNRSSGKMGIALATELAGLGAAVTLVLGPVETRPELSGLQVVMIETAREMYEACLARFDQMDMVIMAAAVADYTPASVSDQKIKKKEETWSLSLTRTPDILLELGKRKRPGQLLVGFALETKSGKEYARSKLHAKNADLMVLNSLEDPGAGFGYDTNKITIFDRDGGEKAFDLKRKEAVARDIADFLVHLSEANIQRHATSA